MNEEKEDSVGCLKTGFGLLVFLIGIVIVGNIWYSTLDIIGGIINGIPWYGWIIIVVIVLYVINKINE
jgi:hypothetical protein